MEAAKNYYTESDYKSTDEISDESDSDKNIVESSSKSSDEKDENVYVPRAYYDYYDYVDTPISYDKESSSKPVDSKITTTKRSVQEVYNNHHYSVYAV